MTRESGHVKGFRIRYGTCESVYVTRESGHVNGFRIRYVTCEVCMGTCERPFELAMTTVPGESETL